MRIACTNHHRKLVGGTESYLARLIPELVKLGHEVSFWHEAAYDSGEPGVDAPEVFLVDAGSPAQLSGWHPHVIFNNGLMDMHWEAVLSGIAPVVHYAHNYYGTCISGEKMRKAPRPTPCTRVMGVACLGIYLPQRCGGRNPVTMWRDFCLQSARLDHLRRARAILVASRHIEQEYRNHAFENVFRVPLFISPAPPAAGTRTRILFSGRMLTAKGGHILLEAIPIVERQLGESLDVIFAGDGPQRSAWEALGSRARFTGWVAQHELRAFEPGLLVMPSLWPEPFGLTGLELGIPAAAFALGGIPDWLREGINGHLAHERNANSLAESVLKCIQDPAHFHSLQAGAERIAREYTLENHLAQLLPVLEASRQ